MFNSRTAGQRPRFIFILQKLGQNCENKIYKNFLSLDCLTTCDNRIKDLKK